MRMAMLLNCVAALVFAQSSRTTCTLSPDVEKAVRALPSVSDLSLSWEERIAPRRTLAEEYPDNWPLQILLQDAIRNHFYIGREWDRAIALYRRMEDRTLGDLLEARLISPFQRKRSREIIERAVRTAPDSPWVHLVAAEWASRPVGRDAAFGEKHLEELRRLCPDNARAFGMLDLVQDAERLAGHVQALRKLLEAKKEDGIAEEDLVLFRAAWPWEKAAASASDEARFLETVRSDVAAVRAIPLYNSGAWYSTLRTGYEQMLKDPAAVEALRREVLQRAPKSLTAWWIEEERTPRQPPPGASREQVDQWRTEHDTAMRERITRFADQPFVRFHLQSLLFHPMNQFEDAEMERMADAILTLNERYPDQGVGWPPVQMMIAEVYARRKIRLDRVPSLVQKALEEIEFQEKYRRNTDAFPSRAGMMDNIAMTQSRSREVLIRHALAIGETERAQAMLAELRQKLQQTKPANDADQAALAWRRDHSIYLSLAKLARIDAAPVAELMPPRPETAERFPVGDFEAKDLTGKRWRLEDLKGKVVYVNVWTTWCGPCREEMPGLQKLYEQWKDREDRVVLTVSADFQEALARDFIREHKYTFPVVHGIADKFFPPVMFPQNWLIDPEGRRLSIRAPAPYDTTMAQIDELADKLASPVK